MMHLCHFQ